MWQTDSGPSIQLTSGPSYQIERKPELNKFSKKAHLVIDISTYRMTMQNTEWLISLIQQLKKFKGGIE